MHVPVQRNRLSLEDQGVILCLVYTLRPVRRGWPYQEYPVRRTRRPGGYSPIKMTEVLVVPFRGQKFVNWYRLVYLNLK